MARWGSPGFLPRDPTAPGCLHSPLRGLSQAPNWALPCERDECSLKTQVLGRVPAGQVLFTLGRKVENSGSFPGDVVLGFRGWQSHSQSPTGYLTPIVRIVCKQFLIPVSSPKGWTLNLALLYREALGIFATCLLPGNLLAVSLRPI